MRTLINRRRQPLKHRYVIDKETWHHHELVVKDQRILVMHKITGLGRVVYATNLSLELLWLLEADTNTRWTQQPLFDLHTQRLYLYASHGLVWLSSAKGCRLVDQETGHEKGPGLQYPSYQRQLPELDSLNEDTSPYAQTGFSIWDIKCVQNRLLIVHDIERCAPVVFDVIHF